MPYLHLGNGDVKELSDKEFKAWSETPGYPHSVRFEGHEHTVIGVHAKERELPKETEE